MSEGLENATLYKAMAGDKMAPGGCELPALLNALALAPQMGVRIRETRVSERGHVGRSLLDGAW